MTAWVFLPDHGHAMGVPRYPATISGVIEPVELSSTRLIYGPRGDTGGLCQGRFFDRALRTAKMYHEKVEYIPLNPVWAVRVGKAEE
jgi:hypothetical protein